MGQPYNAQEGSYTEIHRGSCQSDRSLWQLPNQPPPWKNGWGTQLNDQCKVVFFAETINFGIQKEWSYRTSVISWPSAGIVMEPKIQKKIAVNPGQALAVVPRGTAYGRGRRKKWKEGKEPTRRCAKKMRAKEHGPIQWNCCIQLDDRRRGGNWVGKTSPLLLSPTPPHQVCGALGFLKNQEPRRAKSMFLAFSTWNTGGF